MKKGNPISFFSFQDIITSLTGIMIILVMVISLQLVESTAELARALKSHPEIMRLKETVNSLNRKQEELTRLLEQRKNEPVPTLSVEELAQRLQTEKSRSQELQANLQQLTSEQTAVEARLCATEASLKEIEKRRQLLGKERQRLSAKEKDIALMQKKIEGIKAEIEKKQKSVRLTFSGMDNRKPLLIECNPWGFRCKEFPTGQITTLGTVNNDASAEPPIDNLKNWLTKYPARQYFPVFFFRPDTLHLRTLLEEKITSPLGFSSCGWEVLDRIEECL